MATSAGDKATQLPDDVLEEILSRLPGRSLLRFRTVCRAWCGLLSAPAFIRAHHQRAPRSLLLRRYNPAGGVVYNVHSSIYTLPLHRGDQPAAAPLYMDGADMRQLYLHGCCEGLLLLSQRNKPVVKMRYFVCNPATGERADLPVDLASADQNPVVGFYLHAPTAEYRVLCHVRWRAGLVRRVPSPDGGKMMVEQHEYVVATVGKPAGVRRFQSTSVRLHDGAYINMSANHHENPILRGCLHALTYLREAIAVFDTVSEQFRRTMQLPPPPPEDTSSSNVSWNLARIDGALGAWSLAEFEHRVFRMWVLEDHEEERWAFRYRVDLRLLEGDPLTFVGLAHVDDGGDALLLYRERGRYCVYNIRRGELVTRQELGGGLNTTAVIYRENLVSLTPRAVALGALAAPPP